MALETTVDPSLLLKGDKIYVKSKEADEWDSIVYVVTKNGSTAKEGWGHFKASFICRAGILEQINTGLSCNMPKSGNSNEFSFKRFQVDNIT